MEPKHPAINVSNPIILIGVYGVYKTGSEHPTGENECLNQNGNRFGKAWIPWLHDQVDSLPPQEAFLGETSLDSSSWVFISSGTARCPG